MNARLSALIGGHDLKARLARGAVVAFSINASATALSFLAQLVLARVLGAEGYGTFAYVLAWVAVLATFSALGFQKTLLRFVAAYQARRQWGLLRHVVRYAQTRVALAGLSIMLCGAAVVAALGETLAGDLVWCLLVGLLAVPLVALSQTYSWVIRGLGLVSAALVPVLLFRPALLLLVVGGAGMLVGRPVDPALAMAVVAAAAAAALLVVHVIYSRVRPQAAAIDATAEDRLEWRRSAAALFVLAALQILSNQVGILMVGSLADTSAAGVYAVVCRLADLAVFTLAAVNLVFAPSISALHARGELAALQAIVTTTARWIAVSALAVGLPLLVLAEHALALFGTAFVGGSSALRILLAAQMTLAAAGAASYLLTMTGHERQAVVLFGTTTAIHILLNAALIPPLGVTGAAIAQAAALVTWAFLAVVLVWRRLGINPTVLSRRSTRRTSDDVRLSRPA